MEDAKRAGLGGKDNWRKYPKAMLRARCISGALRAWAPDAIGAGVYVEGEIEASEPAPVASVASIVRSAVADGAPPPSWHEERTVDAEELHDEAPPPPKARPMAMGDCDTVPLLDAWIGQHGAKLARKPDAVARVLAHAAAIGADDDTIAAWRAALGLDAEAAE